MQKSRKAFLSLNASHITAAFIRIFMWMSLPSLETKIQELKDYIDTFWIDVGRQRGQCLWFNTSPVSSERQVNTLVPRSQWTPVISIHTYSHNLSIFSQMLIIWSLSLSPFYLKHGIFSSNISSYLWRHLPFTHDFLLMYFPVTQFTLTFTERYTPEFIHNKLWLFPPPPPSPHALHFSSPPPSFPDTPKSLNRWGIFLLWVYSSAGRASEAPNSCSIIIQAAGARQSILLLLLSSTRAARRLARPPCNQKVTGLIPATANVSISNRELCWSDLDRDIARSPSDYF